MRSCRLLRSIAVEARILCFTHLRFRRALSYHLAGRMRFRAKHTGVRNSKNQPWLSKSPACARTVGLEVGMRTELLERNTGTRHRIPLHMKMCVRYRWQLGAQAGNACGVQRGRMRNHKPMNENPFVSFFGFDAGVQHRCKKHRCFRAKGGGVLPSAEGQAPTASGTSSASTNGLY